MPELRFQVNGVAVLKGAAIPTLSFALAVTNARAEEQVHSIALSTQLQIEPARRRYSETEKRALADMFGEPERWSSTVRPLYWTTVSTPIPGFTGATHFELRVPCTFDFNVAATKYFHALDEGEIPVALMFSGMVFYVAGESFQVAPIPWAQEASCRIPARAWKEMMALYYPNAAWLTLRRDVFERLYRYKVRHGLPTWEQMMEHVLAAAGDRG